MLGKNDLLYGISVPVKNKRINNTFSGFIKVGTRKSMECSVVSLAYHIQTDSDGNVFHSGIAIGASAPTIKFAESACEFLTGKNVFRISKKEKKEFAEQVLSYAFPISDIRASAWYRKKVLYNISKSILENL